MAAMCMCQGKEGMKNIMRFAASWKTGSKEAVARELMKGFGYVSEGLCS